MVAALKKCSFESGAISSNTTGSQAPLAQWVKDSQTALNEENATTLFEKLDETLSGESFGDASDYFQGFFFFNDFIDSQLITQFNPVDIGNGQEMNIFFDSSVMGSNNIRVGEFARHFDFLGKPSDKCLV